jgi:hypothetical protein
MTCIVPCLGWDRKCHHLQVCMHFCIYACMRLGFKCWDHTRGAMLSQIRTNTHTRARAHTHTHTQASTEEADKGIRIHAPTRTCTHPHTHTHTIHTQRKQTKAQEYTPGNTATGIASYLLIPFFIFKRMWTVRWNCRVLYVWAGVALSILNVLQDRASTCMWISCMCRLTQTRKLQDLAVTL